MKKAILCGDRNWIDYKAIEKVVKDFGIDYIIEGGARGADYCAKMVGKNLKIPVSTVEAEWTKYGKAAGPKRNKAMLDKNPDYVIGFHNYIGGSKGTKNCLDQAKKLGSSKVLLVSVEKDGKLVIREY